MTRVVGNQVEAPDSHTVALLTPEADSLDPNLPKNSQPQQLRSPDACSHCHRPFVGGHFVHVPDATSGSMSSPARGARAYSRVGLGDGPRNATSATRNSRQSPGRNGRP